MKGKLLGQRRKEIGLVGVADKGSIGYRDDYKQSP
jgi:hypothetical protein